MAFGLARKAHIRKVLLTIVCTAIIVVLTVGVVKIIKNRVNAATEDGDKVTLTYGDAFQYGSDPDTRTFIYTIRNVDGGATHTAFCGNPHTPPPDDNGVQHTANIVTTSTSNLKGVLLAIYAYINMNSSSAARSLIDEMFPASLGISDAVKYGWIHSIVSSYYDVNDNNLNGNAYDEAILNAAKAKIDAAINNNQTVWVEATQYDLYMITQAERQTIFWIEKTPVPLGSIVIVKKDAETHSTTPQGNATFNGITFIVRKNNTEVGSCTLSNNNSSCTVNDIEYGEYTVTETQGTNVSYQISSSFQTVNLNSSTISVEFENEVKKGSIKVRKKDSSIQGNECRTTSGHSFNGVTFGLYLSNNNQNSIIYNNNTYVPSSVQDPMIASRAIGATGCEVVFENVPYGNYYVKEIATNNYYVINNESKPVTVTGNGSVIEVEFSNDPTSIGTVAVDNADNDKYVETSRSATIKDTISYCLETGRTYTITGVLMDKSTNSPLLIGGQRVESSVTITPTVMCGTTSMTFTFNAEGLAGKEIVVFETAYDGNTPVVEHANINDPNQTVTVIGLDTSAEDNADGDKFIKAAANAVVKDTVSYCLKTGVTYTITGVLMDKSTNSPLLIGGQRVESSVTVTPTEPCGTTTMTFTFNAEGLAGKSIVAFESVYENNVLIIAHTDINDDDQTVDVVEYSISTKAYDGTGTDVNDKYIETSSSSTIKDNVTYCGVASTSYQVQGKVVNKSTGTAVTELSSPITVTTGANGCGNVTMTYTVDTSRLGGASLVVYEYLLDNNDAVATHEDPDDPDQTVTVISLKTYAFNKADGSKVVIANKDAVISDKVEYCLGTGRDYVIASMLADQETGEAVILETNSGPKIVETEITPETDCGEVTINYALDATKLAGHKLVMLAAVLYNDETILIHDDLDNADQTISVIAPEVPDTGFITGKALGGNEQGSPIILSVATAGMLLIGFFGARIVKRRHILR